MDTWGAVGESPEEASSPVVSLDPPARPLREQRTDRRQRQAAPVPTALNVWMLGADTESSLILGILQLPPEPLADLLGSVHSEHAPDTSRLCHLQPPSVWVTPRRFSLRLPALPASTRGPLSPPLAALHGRQCSPFMPTMDHMSFPDSKALMASLCRGTTQS